MSLIPLRESRIHQLSKTIPFLDGIISKDEKVREMGKEFVEIQNAESNQSSGSHKSPLIVFFVNHDESKGDNQIITTSLPDGLDTRANIDEIVDSTMDVAPEKTSDDINKTVFFSLFEACRIIGNSKLGEQWDDVANALKYVSNTLVALFSEKAGVIVVLKKDEIVVDGPSVLSNIVLVD